MASLLALIGGEEFAEGFEDVHAELAELAYTRRRMVNSHPLQIVFLPTCAAHDGPETVRHWSELAQQRLGKLGARVSTPQVIDRESAEDPENARQVAEADWIYIGGGYPHVGMQILSGTQTLEALHSARARGALVSGASAGAMLLCARSWVITAELDRTINSLLEQKASMDDVQIPLPSFVDCLGLVPGSLCWPHLNQFFSMRWVEQGMVPADCTMLGIDEQTAIVSADTEHWQVLGRGRAVIINPNHHAWMYKSGQQFNL